MPTASSREKAVPGSTNSRRAASRVAVLDEHYLYALALPSFTPSISPMNAVASPSSRPQSSTLPTPPWEFTRRKRWADLIVTELSEAIVLVLSPGRKVLYCNPSVREMLGWQDDDLVDMDFTELVNGLYPPFKLTGNPAHQPFCASSE